MSKARRKPTSDSLPGESGAGEEEDSPSFEQALQALERVVDRLEDGEIPLEEALVEFERGVALSRRCRDQLDAVERRIEMLIDQNEEESVRPFELKTGDADALPEAED